jgi:uncharacterized protein (TIGR02147 family)
MVLKISEGLKLKAEIIEKYINAMDSAEVSTKKYEQLAFDTYKTISEWFHFAILELVSVKNFDQSPKGVAKLLNITVEQAQEALERLVRLKLLKVDVNGRLNRTSHFLTTTEHHFTNDALVNLQSGLMERSLFALRKVAFDRRDHSSMTMAINSKRLPEAKRRIKKFRRALCEDLQVESDRDSVYQLLISFFPLTPAKAPEHL